MHTTIISNANQFANLLFNLRKYSKENLVKLFKNNLQNEDSFLHIRKLKSNYKMIAFIILKVIPKDAIASYNLDLFFSTFTEARELVEQERENSWALLESDLLDDEDLVEERKEEIKENFYAFKCLVLGGAR